MCANQDRMAYDAPSLGPARCDADRIERFGARSAFVRRLLAVMNWSSYESVRPPGSPMAGRGRPAVISERGPRDTSSTAAISSLGFHAAGDPAAAARHRREHELLTDPGPVQALRRAPCPG